MNDIQISIDYIAYRSLVPASKRQPIRNLQKKEGEKTLNTPQCTMDHRPII